MSREKRAETVNQSRVQACDATLTGGAPKGAARTDDTLTAGTSGATLTLTQHTATDTLADKVDWEIGDVIDGKYEVRAELGRGGMGKVYQVHHREWDIDMAVKMPLARLVADETSKARFVREAETWVEIGLHPHIVQCWYVREFGGIPRVFVDYMSGGSLKGWIEQGKVRPGEWAKIIDLVIQACDGLAYAHEKGIIHRDVKPANMLMAEDDRLCVTDFGLAKVVGAAEIGDREAGAPSASPQQSLTVSGSSVGTPEYGAPEQWLDAKSVDVRADVYSLGVVLFELCLGRRPFDDGSHSEPVHVLIARHLSTPAPNPSELAKEMPEALAVVVARCLAKKPNDRPDSASALRAELALAHHQVVGAPYRREPPRPGDLRADALNNRAVSLWDLGRNEAALAALDEALRLDSEHLTSLYNMGLIGLRSGELAVPEVERRLSAAKQGDRRAGLYLGHIHLERATADEAERELLEALQDAEIGKDGTAWRALGDARMAQGNYAKAAEAYEKALEHMPADPLTLRNLRLAALGTREHDGRIEFPWRHCLRKLEGCSKSICTLALTPDPHFVVSGSHEETPRLWDLAKGVCLRTFRGHTASATAVAVTPHGGFLVSGSHDNTLRLWKLHSGACLRALHGHTGEVIAVTVTPDGYFAVSGSRDRTLRLWKLTTGECIRIFDGHAADVNAVAVTPDGRFAVSGSGDHTVRLWDLSTGACLRIFRGHTSWVLTVAVTPDGRFAVSGGGDHTVRVWDLATGLSPSTLQRHRGNVNAVAVTPDSRFIVSGSGDHTVRLWDLGTGACLNAFDWHASAVDAVAATLDGRVIVSESSNRTLGLWELEAAATRHRVPLRLCKPQTYAQAQTLQYQFEQHLGQARAALASDNAALAYHHVTLARAVSGYSRHPSALALNATLAQSIPATGLRASWVARKLEGHNTGGGAVAVTHDGRFALSGDPDGDVRVWEIATGACVRTFHQTCDVFAIAVTPDGRCVVSGGAPALYVWELATGACLRTLRGDVQIAFAVAVTPDGRRAVSADFDQVLRLWDLATGACLRTFHGHTGWVKSVAVTPTGRFIVSGGTDQTLRLWKLANGRCVRTFEGHTTDVDAVALTPDGRFVVSSDGRTIRVWELATGFCVRAFRGHPSGVNAITVTPDGRFVLSASHSALRLWELATGTCLHTLEDHASHASSVAVTPDSRFVVSGGDDGTVRLWELDWELDPSPAAMVRARCDKAMRGKERTLSERFASLFARKNRM